MKKLTKEEATDLFLSGKGRTTKVSAMVASLHVGEALIISREDWKTKSSPYRVVNYLAKKTGRKFIKGRLPDGSGWAVKRVA